MSSFHGVFGYFCLCVLTWRVMTTQQRLPITKTWPRLLALAIILRALGSLAYYFISLDYYGSSDALTYFKKGILIANSIYELDFTWIDTTFHSTFWGTPIITTLSGVLLTLLGPILLGEFFLFALISLLGVLYYIRAYHATNPQGSKYYAPLICLWPAMWFWPSATGKEALALFGMGLTVHGYIGYHHKIYWRQLACGVTLVFFIRPHVASVLACCLFFAEWLGRGTWTFLRGLQSALLLATMLFALQQMSNSFGFAITNLQEASEFLSKTAQRTQLGGSALAPTSSGIEAFFSAFVKILTRPFLWEVTNKVQLVSALEMTLFWLIIWVRKKAIAHALVNWRTNRFLRLALPFSFCYVVMIGITFFNQGLIARQRTLVLPFLFALIAYPKSSNPPPPHKTQKPLHLVSGTG